MSKRTEPTSRDVARMLGIAQSTVSRAFTPGAPISEPLRERIHAAAARIGYRPNLLARGLIAGRSRLIGLLLAPQTNLLYPELLYELARQLAAHEHQVLLFPADDAATAARAVTRLEAYRVDAVLATGVLGEVDALALVAAGTRLVTFNRLIEGVSGVSCDFRDAGARLMRTCRRAGRKHIALIRGPKGSWVSDEVARGVGTAAGADIRFVTVTASYGYTAAAAALARAERILGRPADAVICVNDLAAAGCRDALRERRAQTATNTLLLTIARAPTPDHHSSEIGGRSQPLPELIGAAVEMLTQPSIKAEWRILPTRRLITRP